MSQVFTSIREWIQNSVAIQGFDILDIIIMTVIIYHVLKLFKNTRAMNVLKGVALLIVALAFASWLHLPTVEWLLSSVVTSGIVIVFVLFQPEFRMFLEKFGRVHLNESGEIKDSEKTVKELISACDNLSRRHVGALLVFEKSYPLKDIAQSGTFINADVSQSLIENIFEPNTPLHDGAMIIKGAKIVSAGCLLPLSENQDIDKNLGTRHRAALGISERSDALVVVVSEETGVISFARGGKLSRYLSLDNLERILTELYTPKEESNSKFAFITKLFGKEQKNEQEE